VPSHACPNRPLFVAPTQLQRLSVDGRGRGQEALTRGAACSFAPTLGVLVVSTLKELLAQTPETLSRVGVVIVALEFMLSTDYTELLLPGFDLFECHRCHAPRASCFKPWHQSAWQRSTRYTAHVGSSHFREKQMELETDNGVRVSPLLRGRVIIGCAR
jgi:hypothetical protein